MNVYIRTLTASVALLGLSGAAALAQQQTDPNATPPAAGAPDQAGQTATGTDGMQGNGERYGSFEAQRDTFEGTIAGEYTADELMGKDVVGPDDETVGTVADLLIDSNDQVSKVILDVGGFLGMGTRTVAVDIAELQAPAEEDGDLRINMTRDQVENLPEHERDDDGWFSS